MTENYRALDVGLAWWPEGEIILANNHKSQNYQEKTSVSTQAIHEDLIPIWKQYQEAYNAPNNIPRAELFTVKIP